MYLEFKENKLKSYLRLANQTDLISDNKKIKKGFNHIFWNQSNHLLRLKVNGLPIDLEHNQITTATELQEIEFCSGYNELTTLSFNKEFYCIKEHEEEVSCNGVIFYGTQDIPVITLDESETQKMQSLFLVFEEEFNAKETAQGEMLEMLLTRMIIKCTRLAKEQLALNTQNQGASDIVRTFTQLVDRHFKTTKNVSQYAEMLNKSPKTLANSFSKHSNKTPLRMIHERLITEAQRMLHKTDKTAKEIAYELGFEDASAFNKLFKKINGQSPIEYKRQSQTL